VFSILKIKKCKEGMSQKNNQRTKKKKKSEKQVKNMNPKQKTDHGSVQIQVPLLLLLCAK